MAGTSGVGLVEQLRRENVQLRQVVAVKDAEIGQLLALVKAQGLRIEELERRLGSGSDDSGTPTSKDSIEAKARKKAERKARREQGGSSRERSTDRERGAQPGHVGRGLMRDPNPTERVGLAAPTTCRCCGGGLDDCDDAGTAWSQVWDVQIVRRRVEYLLPRRRCGCTAITTACPPDGGVVNGVSFGPVLNGAAVALSAFGNVPTERAAMLVEILLGQRVSAGFVDRANARLAERLEAGGFEIAMRAALLAEGVLTADESPVEVVTPATDPDTGQPVAGSPHVMVIRTPDERLMWLSGLVSRCHDVVIAGLRGFAGHLIVDGYAAYQRLLKSAGGLLAGIQQCCVHVMRRCRAVAKLAPTGLQASWTDEITKALNDAHKQVQAARVRDEPALDAARLADLRGRYDRAVATGIIHNRQRDWDGPGRHPGYSLAVWLRDFADQVWHFTTYLHVDWSSNAAERGVKPAKRHQAVSGYWQTDQTLSRWCLIQSYLTSARNHGLTVLDAITRALAGDPWLPEPIAA